MRHLQVPPRYYRAGGVLTLPACGYCGVAINEPEGAFYVRYNTYREPLPCDVCVTARMESFDTCDTLLHALEPIRTYAARYRAFEISAEPLRLAAPYVAGVYAIRWTLDDGSDAVYIGQSENVHRRVVAHLSYIRALFLGPQPSTNELLAHIEHDEEMLFFPLRTPIGRVPPRQCEREILARLNMFCGAARTSSAGENIVYDAVARKFGIPRAIEVLERISVQPMGTLVERLSLSEAKWHDHFLRSGNAHPLWVANTRRFLSG